MYLGYLLLVILGAFPYFSKAQQQQAPSQEEDKIHRFFLDRCKIYSSDATNYDNFMSHLEQFTSYAQYTMNILSNDKRQFCNEERNRLSSSMNVLVKDLSQCLPKDEKYLSKFLSTSFDSFLEFLCINNGKNIDIYFNSTHGKSCRDQLSQGNAVTEVGNCFNKIFAPLSGYIKKKELCDDLDIAKKCFTVVLEEYCRDFKSFQILNSRFFTAISKPCSSCLLISSNLLLIVAFFTVKLFR